MYFILPLPPAVSGIPYPPPQSFSPIAWVPLPPPRPASVVDLIIQGAELRRYEPTKPLTPLHDLIDPDELKKYGVLPLPPPSPEAAKAYQDASAAALIALQIAAETLEGEHSERAKEAIKTLGPVYEELRSAHADAAK